MGLQCKKLKAELLRLAVLLALKIIKEILKMGVYHRIHKTRSEFGKHF